MTRRGFGTTEELPSGKWRAKYMHEGRRHDAPHTFLTRADADLWLAGEQLRIAGHEWTPPDQRAQETAKRTTVADYVADAVADRDIAPKTRSGYDGIIRLHIRPTFGDVLLSEITAKQVRRWFDSMASTPTYRARSYALLAGCMATAYTAGLVAENPCQIKKGSKVKRTTATDIATVEEVALIVKAMPDRFKAMVLVSAWLGLRFGEVTELRRRDVDLHRAVLNVHRGVVYVPPTRADDIPADAPKTVGDANRIIGPTKTEGSVRTLPLPPHLVTALEDHLRDHVGPTRDALLFPSMTDPSKHLSTNSFNAYWHAARALVGRDDLRFHDLRHTAGTRFTQRGATLKEVMSLLGHATPSAALRYQQATDQRMRELALRMTPDFMG